MESPLLVTWLQRCAALAAWLWVAPEAGALPTFMPLDVPTPRVGAVSGAAVRLPSPFTLLGQAAIAGASDAVPNGNLVYVCGSSGISVFDVTNVTAPQFLRTVGTPADTCQIRGDRLVALRGGDTLVLALYTLTDPQNPQHLGSTPEIFTSPRELSATKPRALLADAPQEVRRVLLCSMDSSRAQGLPLRPWESDERADEVVRFRGWRSSPWGPRVQSGGSAHTE